MPRIQHKRGTSANLASVNPTPLAGELVWDSTENAIKIGDGATAWSSLAYVTATPRSHASTHATGGSDALSPSDIGAATAESPTFTGTATFEGVILADDSTSTSAPVYSFTGDPNCGLAHPAADTCSIVTAGSERLRVKSGGVVRYIPLTADPASGEAGDVYYNSTLQKLRVYNGSRWVSLHGSAWDISTASLSGSFSVASQEEDPTDIAFKPDGLRMYIAGFDNNIYEYDLAVAWDVTTATYSQSFSVAAQETGNRGVTFSANGSKMFTIGITGDDVNEYALSTPWDVSTATYTTNFSVGDKEGTPTSVKFSVDGTKMYVLGLTTDHVYQYALSAAFDVSTATYSQSFSVLSQESTPWSVWLRPDGLRMYVMGYTGDDVNEYVLSTAWDITTATYAQVFSVAAEETDPRGLAFSADGTRMYVTGRTNDKVHQYSLL